MSEQRVDLTNRDPSDLNSHIKVCFEDVLGEPDGVRSMDCVWTNSYKCFECCKSLCYKLLTLLCGICIAMAWGCDFAGTAFTHIWCWTPCIRDFSICVGCAQKIFGTYISCCLSPICESCGMVFSKIRITK